MFGRNFPQFLGHARDVLFTDKFAKLKTEYQRLEDSYLEAEKQLEECQRTEPNVRKRVIRMSPRMKPRPRRRSPPFQRQSVEIQTSPVPSITEPVKPRRVIRMSPRMKPHPVRRIIHVPSSRPPSNQHPPTRVPSAQLPSRQSSIGPSRQASVVPSRQQSFVPSRQASIVPSRQSSVIPSRQQSYVPSRQSSIRVPLPRQNSNRLNVNERKITQLPEGVVEKLILARNELKQFIRQEETREQSGGQAGKEKQAVDLLVEIWSLIHRTPIMLLLSRLSPENIKLLKIEDNQQVILQLLFISWNKVPEALREKLTRLKHRHTEFVKKIEETHEECVSRLEYLRAMAQALNKHIPNDDLTEFIISIYSFAEKVPSYTKNVIKLHHASIMQDVQHMVYQTTTSDGFDTVTYIRIRVDGPINKRYKAYYRNAPSQMLQIDYMPQDKILRPMTYMYGPFTRIFTDKRNKGIAQHCSEMKELLQRRDVLVMGYGPSGAGKTVTLIGLRGPQKEDGVIVQLLNEIGSNTGASLQIEAIEYVLNQKNNIAGEFRKKNPGKIKLTVIPTKIEFVMGDQYYDTVSGISLAQFMLECANNLRITARTPNNPESSRGHLIFKVSFSRSTLKDLYIADLAGVEGEFACNTTADVKKFIEDKYSSNYESLKKFDLMKMTDDPDWDEFMTSFFRQGLSLEDKIGIMSKLGDLFETLTKSGVQTWAPKFRDVFGKFAKNINPKTPIQDVMKETEHYFNWAGFKLFGIKFKRDKKFGIPTLDTEGWNMLKFNISKPADFKMYFKQRVEAYKTCFRRKAEGVFIMASLGAIRRNLMNPTANLSADCPLKRSPLYFDACALQNCPFEPSGECFAMRRNSFKSKNNIKSNLPDILDLPQRPALIVFGVLNLSQGVDDPQTLPYVDPTELRRLIADSDEQRRHVVLNHTQKWIESNKSFIPEITFEKLQRQIDEIRNKSLSNTEYNRNHTRDLTIELFDMISDINQTSSLGVLDYLDNIAKYTLDAARCAWSLGEHPKLLNFRRVV